MCRVPSNPVQKCLVLVVAPMLLLSLAWGDAAASAQLGEMSIEALLEQELVEMEVTGIHHTHPKGEWMIGYHYMRMNMEGNLDGTSDVSVPEIFAEGFMVAPTSMWMEMHMIHGMYGLTDKLTLMIVLPFERKSMDHVRAMGLGQFTTTSGGISDLEFTALYSLWRTDRHRLIGGLTITAPTGSIDVRGFVPGMMGNPVRLPYPMQLGSGTWDFIPELTYIGQVPKWQWGANVGGTLRAGTNDNNYTLGNAYEVMAWGARKLTDWSSLNVRLKWSQWFNIDGADPQLNPMMVPTADPNRRAGRRLDFLAGLSVFTGSGKLEGLRLTVDGGTPIYQSLDGPQLETDWMVGAMLEWTFGS